MGCEHERVVAYVLPNSQGNTRKETDGANNTQTTCCCLLFLRATTRSGALKQERRRADGHTHGRDTESMAQQRQGSLSDPDDRAAGGFGVPAEYVTTGWRPTCKHEAPIKPAIVLDPFFGSGTTGLVAAKAGRDWIGIELNPAYVEMAERRLMPVKGRLL